MRRPRFGRGSDLGRRWPLTVRIPLVVVLLMIVVSVLISERVLTRFLDTQRRHLTQLTDTYLDGVASALQPNIMRKDVWEIYDVLDRAMQRTSSLDVAWTTVTDAKGRVVASSDPKRHRIETQFSNDAWPPQMSDPGPPADLEGDTARFRRALSHQGRTLGTIHLEVRTAGLLEERRSVLITLILTNFVLTLFLAFAGYMTIRRMLRPVALLADHMRVDVDGDLRQIPDSEVARSGAEFSRLFRRYNSLITNMRERQQLMHVIAEEERLAALGRLASGMAHEINNPLGGMLNAVETLKRHGGRDDVRKSTADLIERGLRGIRDVVRSTLSTYRTQSQPDPLSAQHVDDLAILIRPELLRRNVSLDWRNAVEGTVAIPAHPVRDASLNLLLNACAACPSGGEVSFVCRERSGKTLEIAVGDRGAGLPRAVRSALTSAAEDHLPSVTGGRLGLWIVRKTVQELGGVIRVEDRRGGGTWVRLRLPVGRTMPLQSLELEISDDA